MGFFDFVKDAGRRLGIGDKAPTPDDLRAEVTKIGLDVKDYTVDIKDDTVVVSGLPAPAVVPGCSSRRASGRFEDRQSPG